MTSERKNIPLRGLFREPRGLDAAPPGVRAEFWRRVGEVALRLKRGEIERGIDPRGGKFLPVKRKWGDPTPLIPHGTESRTYRLLTLTYSARGATLYWRTEGGREPWRVILGYHAYRHGPRALPVRDQFGLGPKSVESLSRWAADIWRDVAPKRTLRQRVGGFARKVLGGKS